MSDFCHLHLHTEYSLLDGANRPEEVTKAASQSGMPAIALTDHGNMFGAIDFYKSAKKAGIKPIIGIEAYTAKGDRKDKGEDNRANNHLVLLAKNKTGYKNLLKLSTDAYLEGFYYKPRMDESTLREHREGLICLSGCLKGEIPEAITSSRREEAEEKAKTMLDIFGPGNFYLELQDHGIVEQSQANETLVSMSKKLDIPLVATNDCHYLNRDDAVAHDALLCIGTRSKVSDPDRMRYASDEFYLKSEDEVKKIFGSTPEGRSAIENTVRIAEQCNLEIPLGEDAGHHLPEFPVPSGHTPDSYLTELCFSALEKVNLDIRYTNRLTMELQVIKNMGFPGYFLVVWDFIRHAKREGIPVGPGRGSAAGSLVSYCLGITDIDPIKYDLLFERFLNPDRISLPDIDIDFCKTRREEMIDYVSDTYGRDHVGQIITFGTLAAKSVIRDVTRVLGLPYEKGDRLSKMVPDMTKSLSDEIRINEPIQSEMARDPDARRVMRLGERLCGLTRHSGTHAAGIVITPEPLVEMVPLCRPKGGSEGAVTTQWDMGAIEDLGLLKLDFLGLKTLTVIAETMELLRKIGIDFDLSKVPLDDTLTYSLLQDGKALGVFQFESGGMRDLLIRARPSCLEDLAALNALYRPGPLSMGMVDEYVERKHGRSEVTHEFEELWDLLSETYGVIVYQEQVMRIASDLAGFTMAQADTLRKAMGKKKPEEMEAMKDSFVHGMVENGHPEEASSRLWDYIEPFAGYGFNKSHAVAYSLLAYQTAYLKAHYPAQYMSALLNSEVNSTDDIKKYIDSCVSEMGLEVLPPDANKSRIGFCPEGTGIRYGLRAIKGVGESAAGAIQMAKEASDEPVKGLSHLASRVDLGAVNRGVLAALVKAGCFDYTGYARGDLLAHVDEAVQFAQKSQSDKNSGQGSLFSMMGALEPEPSCGAEWTSQDKLDAELEVFGFYFSGHPMDFVEVDLETLTSHTIDKAKDARGVITIAGIVEDKKEFTVKSGKNEGKKMARITLSDQTGSIDVVLFSPVYSEFKSFLTPGQAILVRGECKARGAETQVILEKMKKI